LIMLLAQLDISFEPAFVFPGEAFRVHTRAQANVSSPDLRFIRRGDVWQGVGPMENAEIYATIGPEGAFTDAVMEVLPVAKNKPIANVGGLEVVPMQGDLYGAILAGKRFASLVSFSLAPRSAPERDRPFEVDYVYVGTDSVTLAGNAGGLLRASVHIEPGRLTFNGVPLFEFTGTISLLGDRREISSSPGGRIFLSIVIPNSVP